MAIRAGILMLLWAAAAAAVTPPFHTEGRHIVDARGARVKLAAVNWYGAEEKDYVVAGLDAAPLTAIAHSIRTMGFNAVRLPWSNEMYESDPVVAPARLAANPDLQGMTALEVFDAVVDALAAEGLFMILDNHTSDADWCCSATDGNGFWYNAAYPESSWIADWKGMAARYADQPAVIGADLRNEPRGPVWGGGDRLRDWGAAAERGGNAVLSANPNLLIFVEGIGYAANLTGAQAAPVQLNVDGRLVYSSHDYSWFHKGLSGYDALKAALDKQWGFLIGAGTPVWVGEFGTCHTSASCVSSTTPGDSGYWFSLFTRYLQERDLDWAYWALNGTQATGTSRTLGAVESFGILNKSWTGAASAALLNALQALVTPSAAPAIHHGGIVNAASFLAGAPVAPGSLAAVFGEGLAGVTASAAGVPLPLALGGAGLQANTGAALPVLFASPAQMNVQIPWELDPAAAASVTASVGSLTSAAEPLPLATAAPAIFRLGSGTQGAVTIGSSATVAAVASAALPGARPVRPGEFIVIYCTGLGPVSNQPATGAASPASPLAAAVFPAAVQIGSIECTPAFAGLTPGLVGLYQVNVQVPANAPAGDAVPVQMTVKGVQSNSVTIAIE